MSSILQPEIIKIGSRRYRKNLVQQTEYETSQPRPYEEETSDMYYENRNYDDEPSCKVRGSSKIEEADDNDDDDDGEVGIEFGANGLFKCVLIVAQSYFGYIIGRNGEKKSALERDTHTSIKTPGRGKSGDWISIEGKTKSSVASCRNRIMILISTARHQKPFTHMLTYPVNFDGFKAKLREFKSLVLKTCLDDRGIDDSIFPFENKLHLTICTVTLLSENEVDEAVRLLDQCRNSFIRDALRSKPAMVRIRGLEYMNDDPSDVDVLYAKVEPFIDESNKSDNDDGSHNPIQLIADQLLNRFVESGLSKRQFDRVKLHSTIMHSILRQDTSGPDVQHSEEDKNSRRSFDVRNVLAHFADFDFGVYRINEVHLSLRYSSGPDGYYKCISKVDL